MKKLFLTLFICSFIVTMLINQNTSASIEKKIDNNFASIAQKINKEISLRSELASSSNPYDYIQGNDDFNEIINLGNDALPYLHKKLSRSEHDGLQEYITAIAIERIAKVDLKKTSQWETAKDFNSKWKKHLASIPATVDAIASDSKVSSDEKAKRLLELGTPAIPFILEKVESGNEELFPVVIELTKGSKVEATESVKNKMEWATNNKDSFKDLKKHVVEQQ
ncbi:hypothetical protein [Effusibacillus consociatus]|uniref:Uncharacterized protein n=1 Tax=Effusibacillus consociatus TaxID=1117041 RepID=A0ABV9QAN3_9BACL